jgi:polar amino acid transport system substrate-binding protein
LGRFGKRLFSNLKKIMTVPSHIIQSFAPTGKLRAAINLGNPILAQFVEDMKASGFILDALARHGVKGASVAPLSASD